MIKEEPLEARLFLSALANTQNLFISCTYIRRPHERPGFFIGDWVAY